VLGRRRISTWHETRCLQVISPAPELKAVEALKADGDGRAVAAKMKEMPTDDPLFGKGFVRTDGRKMHDAYLFEVKKPEESKYSGDLYKMRATIPAAEAFRPLKEGGCPLVGGWCRFAVGSARALAGRKPAHTKVFVSRRKSGERRTIINGERIFGCDHRRTALLHHGIDGLNSQPARQWSAATVGPRDIQGCSEGEQLSDEVFDAPLNAADPVAAVMQVMALPDLGPVGLARPLRRVGRSLTDGFEPRLLLVVQFIVKTIES
jgi:hypothetical protein